MDADLAAVLAQAGYAPVCRLTVLAPDLVTLRATFALGTAALLSGSVTGELRRDVRWSASMQLDNSDGSLSPVLADDLLAAGSVVRVERGALVDGVPSYAPLMVGYVSTCEPSMAGTIDIAVESCMSALAQEVGAALTLPAGTFLVDALHTLWDPVLPFISWAVDQAALARSLGADIPVLATDSRLDVGMRLAGDLGVDAYDDREGRLVVALRPDRTTAAPRRTMTEPLDLRRTIGRTPVNAQAVEATPSDKAPFYVLVEVDDPASPIHRDRIGLRLAPTIHSDVVPDPDTARALARTVLAERAMAQDQLTVSSLPHHLDLEPGDVVLREEVVTRTGGRWVIDSITIPLGPGAVTTVEISSIALYLATLT